MIDRRIDRRALLAAAGTLLIAAEPAYPQKSKVDEPDRLHAALMMAAVHRGMRQVLLEEGKDTVERIDKLYILRRVYNLSPELFLSLGKNLKDYRVKQTQQVPKPDRAPTTGAEVLALYSDLFVASSQLLNVTSKQAATVSIYNDTSVCPCKAQARRCGVLEYLL